MLLIFWIAINTLSVALFNQIVSVGLTLVEYAANFLDCYSYTINRNEFFTKYDPVKFNTSLTFNNQSTDLYRYRTNCYGYAFGFLLNNGTTNGVAFGPGYFSNYGTIPNVSGLNVEQYAQQLANSIVDDANHISLYTSCDYTLTEYTPSSGVTTVPQYGSNSRLVALATGLSNGNDYGYHFYLQNSDGTWSHKNGDSNVSNLSLIDDNHPKSFILTNDNILSNAKRGASANGPLKFFIITKSHSILPYNSYNSFSSHDNGDYLETAPVYNGSINLTSHLEYDNDVDTYYLTSTTSKQYRIRTTFDEDANPDYELTIEILNNAGIILVTQSDAISLDFYYPLTGGNQYYIRVYCADVNYTQETVGLPFDYTLSIT